MREAQATQTVKAPVRARLVVPVQMVPGLIAALQDNFRLYQESFGPPKGRSTRTSEGHSQRTSAGGRRS